MPHSPHSSGGSVHTHVIRNVLDTANLARIRELIQRGAFVGGAESAAGAAEQVKANEQLRPTPQDGQALAELAFQALARSRDFHRCALPVEISLPLINRYRVGMSYGPHFDRAFMMGANNRQIRADLSATLFVSPPEDYDGGELCLGIDGGDGRVKLDAGSLFIYPSCLLHSVSAVTRGTRLAIVFWVQSMIRDHEQRSLISNLDQVVGSLAERMPGSIEVRELSGTVNALTRMWGEAG
jgi:PKHD-type hydroxylase